LFRIFNLAIVVIFIDLFTWVILYFIFKSIALYLQRL
jgi:hypothetical protein